jgi:GDP-L-fucose synthase
VKEEKIYLAGHTGLVGSAILSRLKYFGFKKIITVSRNQLDLCSQNDVYNFLKKNNPKFVIIAAAKVGGILANEKYRANFIYENLAIQNNLIHGSFLNKIKNLIFLGSSCVYPKFSKQPIKEEYLLTGKLETTSEPYAIAKIAGIKMCESYNRQHNTNYKCLMPSNSYGPGDHYDLDNSHFFPAIIKKLYVAKMKNNNKKIIFWGPGQSKREMTYVDDLAEAIIFFLKNDFNKNEKKIEIERKKIANMS